jgi:hypothetical protein
MGWDRATPFIIDLQVGAEDIDGLGHANNAVYVTWLERCAWRHSQRLAWIWSSTVVWTGRWQWCGTRSITWRPPTKATNCNWRPGSSIGISA